MSDNPDNAPPRVAPMYCDQCRAPMTEVEPGVWACVRPAADVLPADMLEALSAQVRMALRARTVQAVGEAWGLDHRRHQA